MTRKITKAIVCLVLALILATSFITPAFAAGVISNVAALRLFSVPDTIYGSNRCTNISGIGIGKTMNSLFVVKCYDKNNETDAAFYYYPDMDSPSSYRVYRLKYAGHANGMAVDNSYIYITASTTTDGTGYPHATTNNSIIRISRSLIASLSTGSTINYSDYTSFAPVVQNANGTYSNYTGDISAITKYNNNGKFIINYSPLTTTSAFAFTTAQIKTVSGQDKFVVSTSNSDVFFVDNNLAGSGTSNVDICYSPNCGLFIPKWYGKMASPYTNRNKNVILWVNNVTGSYTYQNVTGIGNCRYYTARKINHVVNDTSGGYTLTKYEMESIAFTDDDDFIYSANVTYTQTSTIGTSNENSYDDDGIFNLYYNDTNHSKFTLSNYNVF